MINETTMKIFCDGLLMGSGGVVIPRGIRESFDRERVEYVEFPMKPIRMTIEPVHVRLTKKRTRGKTPFQRRVDEMRLRKQFERK